MKPEEEYLEAELARFEELYNAGRPGHLKALFDAVLRCRGIKNRFVNGWTSQS